MGDDERAFTGAIGEKPVEHLPGRPALVLGIEVALVDEARRDALLGQRKARIEAMVEGALGRIEGVHALEALRIGADDEIGPVGEMVRSEPGTALIRARADRPTARHR